MDFLLEEIIDNYINAWYYEGLWAFEKIIIETSLASLSQRENPRVLCKSLVSWLGTDFYEFANYNNICFLYEEQIIFLTILDPNFFTSYNNNIN